MLTDWVWLRGAYEKYALAVLGSNFCALSNKTLPQDDGYGLNMEIGCSSWGSLLINVIDVPDPNLSIR